MKLNKSPIINVALKLKLRLSLIALEMPAALHLRKPIPNRIMKSIKFIIQVLSVAFS